MRRFAFKFWDLFGQRNLQRNRSRKPRRPLTARLELETLEDRTVPSGNGLGYISGMTFVDAAHTGVFAPGDPVLPGVVMTLSGTANTGAAVNLTATSDASGAFVFRSVQPGTYQLSAAALGYLGGDASFGNLGGSAAGAVVNGLPLGANQSVQQGLGFRGLSPDFISLALFLSSTTAASFPSAPAGPTANSGPVLSTPIDPVVVGVNSPATSIDLVANFSDADITDGNTEVTFNTSDGPINVTLDDATAPQTVANFLDYVESGDYDNIIFTRLATGFVLQGGAATLNTDSSGSTLDLVPVGPTVNNEFSIPNTQFTLAMAQQGGNPNSATNQFFFNLVNNSATGTASTGTNLDAQKFTVFGAAADASSQQVITTLATAPVQNESTSATAMAQPAVDYSTIPMPGYSGTNFPTDATASNFLVIKSISVTKQNDFLTYAVVSNSNPSLVQPSINNERLTLNYTPGATGTAIITVSATDAVGAVATATFQVTVNP